MANPQIKLHISADFFGLRPNLNEQKKSDKEMIADHPATQWCIDNGIKARFIVREDGKITPSHNPPLYIEAIFKNPNDALLWKLAW